MKYSIAIIIFVFISCYSPRKLHLPSRESAKTGTQFYKEIATLPREDREKKAVAEILSGNIPAFLRKMATVRVEARDSLGRMNTAEFFVTPDYLSIGSDRDFFRIPLTPMAAQKIADSLNCFLPTRKVTDDIYRAAIQKLEPMPLYIYRDSALIFFHHNLIIEGQRKQQKGLIAGIKKDVVISSKIVQGEKKDRVAIYGWHKPDGRPIQPLYTGHVDWYVDYSHGVRLVYRKIKVNGKWMDYEDVLKDPLKKILLCDEADCSFFRYAY